MDPATARDMLRKGLEEIAKKISKNASLDTGDSSILGHGIARAMQEKQDMALRMQLAKKRMEMREVMEQAPVAASPQDLIKASLSNLPK